MKILVVSKHPRNSKESGICKLMEKENFCVKYSWKNVLKPKDLKGVDLVVSVGGDGTALSASHFLVNTPLLAVNSSPVTSVGALTTITLNELDKKLEEISSGKFKTEKLERIEVNINDESYEPLALNDVFMANEKAYLSSKYEIAFEETAEKQVSSGLIFSTGTGSTAWFKSAGGKPFSAQARYIEMIVREPYLSRLHQFKIRSNRINEGKEMKVVALTNMVLAIDSIREIKLKPEDIVRIRISDKPLFRIV